MTTTSGLQVRGLTVCTTDGRPVVDGWDLGACRGGVLALLGPSGAGKTIALLAVLGLLPPGVQQRAGTVDWDGRARPGGSAAAGWRRQHVGYVGQDPRGSLHPLWPVQRIVGELGGAVVESLQAVGLDPAAVRSRRPHQLSGGQAQRVALARALARAPALLVLDAPPSALAQPTLELVAAVVRDRRDTGRQSTVLVTHDARLAEQLADVVVRVGPPPLPRAAATVHRDQTPRSAAQTPAQTPALTVRGLELGHHGSAPLLTGGHLELHPGEFVAVRGVSGSGKTTVLRALAGLQPPAAGTALAGEKVLPWAVRDRAEPGCIALVAQDPAASLNPARRAGAA
ncbi:MAG: ATP-binding cassette domain-containing protein, partial [Pseudonocardia sp.]|nr:ATP-binding cassette domain-containing protein [Pseudonocardia sp.]